MTKLQTRLQTAAPIPTKNHLAANQNPKVIVEANQTVIAVQVVTTKKMKMKKDPKVIRNKIQKIKWFKKITSMKQKKYETKDTKKLFFVNN